MADAFLTELPHLLLWAANPWKTGLRIQMSGSEGEKKKILKMNDVDLGIKSYFLSL